MKNIKINPIFYNEICNRIIEMNDKGWLDEFSNEHFLIKALEGDVSYFNKYKHLIKGSPYYSDSNKNAINFIINFSQRFNYFYKHFSEKEMKKFVKDQLSSGKKNYDESQFFRALSEINVINFLMAFGPAKLDKAIYEPKLGESGKNPEARLIYSNEITVDVEVKTPGFQFEELTNPIQKGVLLPTILLESSEQSYLKKLCEEKKFNFILPRVDKLKDYINSAGKKFIKPKDKSHINLLFINWTYTNIKRRGYLEAYSLLYNNLNGLLKNKEVALSKGIEEEALEKITAVIVYQDNFDSIIFGDFRNVWNGYNFRLLPNCIINKELVDIDILKNVTRMNIPGANDALMPYEIVVSRENISEVFGITDYINNMIREKMKDKDDNFTYFDKAYFVKTFDENVKRLEKINKLKTQGFIL